MLEEGRERAARHVMITPFAETPEPVLKEADPEVEQDLTSTEIPVTQVEIAGIPVETDTKI
jgi:hypothetical protein